MREARLALTKKRWTPFTASDDAPMMTLMGRESASARREMGGSSLNDVLEAFAREVLIFFRVRLYLTYLLIIWFNIN